MKKNNINAISDLGLFEVEELGPEGNLQLPTP